MGVELDCFAIDQKIGLGNAVIFKSAPQYEERLAQAPPGASLGPLGPEHTRQLLPVMSSIRFYRQKSQQPAGLIGGDFRNRLIAQSYSKSAQ
jgi:hypothetical protein